MTTSIQEFDFSVDLLKILIWQYDKAENLQELITKKEEWYLENHTQFWDNWVVDVFDIRTANEFGLSVWSKILDLPLFGDNAVSPPDYPAFNFVPSGAADDYPMQAFDDGADYGGNFATDSSGIFGIPLEQKRILLRLRYFQLVTRGAVPEINRFLEYLFGPNELYVLDGLDMTMTYVSTGPVSRSMVILFQLLDVLPRPAAVGINFIIADLEGFGFGEFNLNFENGSFITQI